jgi:hypothetical protein
MKTSKSSKIRLNDKILIESRGDGETFALHTDTGNIYPFTGLASRMLKVIAESGHSGTSWNALTAPCSETRDELLTVIAGFLEMRLIEPLKLSGLSQRQKVAAPKLLTTLGFGVAVGIGISAAPTDAWAVPYTMNCSACVKSGFTCVPPGFPGCWSSQAGFESCVVPYKPGWCELCVPSTCS